MRNLALSLLAAGLLALPAQAEWRKFDGQTVPLLNADTWLNAGKQMPSVADLRGKVYILKFFATT